MIIKKCIVAASIMMAVITGYAQVNVSVGDPGNFGFKKRPTFWSFSTADHYYFVFRNTEFAKVTHTLVTADKEGNIEDVMELKFNIGVFNNFFNIVGVYALGSRVIVVMENPDKSAGLNKLTIRVIQGGELSENEYKIGAMEFTKMMNQGNWFVAVTPDKNHLAVVGQMPREKDELNKYKYFFLDDSFKELSSGQLSFPDDTKRESFNNFYASDKGDLYLIENEFDKTYTYPKVYRASVSQPKGTITHVQPADASQKVMSYTTALDDAGNLILAGYYKKKAGFVVGDEQARGTWWYNLSDGKMVMNEFEKPVTNMNAEGLLKNGNTWFLVGEQYKADQERTTQQGTSFEENYTYKHNDALVTGLDETGTKKFDIPLSKNYSGRNFDADLYPAFGIIKGKLAVVYNDQYSKFFPNSSYSNYKLPVLVYINNDGLMEAPVHFAKQLEVGNSSFTLYPQLFKTGKDEIMMLTGNGTNIKGVVFH
jgi:hypothetical protein